MRVSVRDSVRDNVRVNVRYSVRVSVRIGESMHTEKWLRLIDKQSVHTRARY